MMDERIRGLLLGVCLPGRDIDAVNMLRKKSYIKDVKITYGMYDFIAVLETRNRDEYIKKVKELEKLVNDDGPITYLRVLSVVEYREK
ncbi:MAG: hypothetical protein J7K83_00435 [Candidatus Aenigmarchaeota archaeon]|nr:hypothetical protein [Candidatus Aenigmarchaeota archaeon]